jgi:glyoxylase-like metal-dependent hydrolase (beta-lactamase superfamily II)
MKRLTGCWLSASVLAALVLASAMAQAPSTNAPAVHAFKVQGNVWLLSGAGTNIAMQAGKEGVLLVDTGAAGMTDAVLAAIREVTDGPIRYIVNTSVTADHVGGNAVLTALPGGSTSGKGRGPAPAVVAQDNVLMRMSTPLPGGKTPYPAAAWPTDGYEAAHRNLYFNGEAVDVIHEPAAHTDGDSIVYFRGSNVLVTGDIFTTTNLPLIDRKQGGTSKGMLDALNAALDITVPENLEEGGTYVIPGRGRVCDEADLVEYRDMVHELRDRMQNLVNVQHMTLEQVKAKRPVLGWEGRYSKPEWTTDMLVETLYDEFKGTVKK